MKSLGNEIFVQKGEIWSFDVEIVNDKNDPFMPFKKWKNPYIVMTVTSARYEQKGNFRKSWWLNINECFVEKENGETELVLFKRFINTEPLYTEEFNINYILSIYEEFIAEDDEDNDFDIRNYLFYTEISGKKVYKYVKSYELMKKKVMLYQKSGKSIIFVYKAI